MYCLPFYFHEFLCSNQHTIPLLFDDCMTLLEKLQALWYKLNELIEDYDKFKSDFFEWKEEVEQIINQILQEIDNINDRLDKIEQDITDIKQDIKNIKELIEQIQNDIEDIKNSINNINQRIDNLQNQINNLDNRITNIENTLADLNIVVPVELFNENNNSWFVNNIANTYLTTIGSPSGWSAAAKLYDADINPAVSFKVGYLGFPIVYAKLPLIFRKAGTIADNSSSIATLMLAMYRQSQKADPFVRIQLATAPQFTITDEFKFPAAYLVTSTQIGDAKRTELTGASSFLSTLNSSTELSVRVQLTQGSKNAGIIVSGAPVVYEADGYTYVAYIGEHQ